MYEAELREVTKEVTDSGRELRRGTKDRRDATDDRDGSIGSTGTDRKLDSGLDQIIEEEARRRRADRDEDEVPEEDFVPGPWWEILQGYVPGRPGETYLPRFERKTIRVRGDDVDTLIGEKGQPNPGLGYEPDQQPKMWSLLNYDKRDLVIEDEILEEKRTKHRDSDVYSSAVRAEKRKFPRKGDEGEFDETIWTNFNGQDVEISAFNYRSNVKVQEEGDGAVFGICPEGVVSSVAGRLSGYATSGRHSPSRIRLVEIMEKLSGDEVVALHVPVGISTKDHGQPAYAGLAYVQFATSAGLQRALNREVVIGGRAIVMDPCNKEFVLERLIGVLQSFRGPRCVLSGNEEERRSMWRSKMNWWRSDPFEWSYRFQRMLEDPCVSERSE